MRHAFISIWFLDSRIRRLHTDKSHTTRLYDSWLDYPSHIQYVWISLHIKKLSSYVKEALPSPIWYSTKIQKFYDFFAAFIFFSQKKGILFARQHFETLRNMVNKNKKNIKNHIWIYENGYKKFSFRTPKRHNLFL